MEISIRKCISTIFSKRHFAPIFILQSQNLQNIYNINPQYFFIDTNISYTRYFMHILMYAYDFNRKK